MSIYQALKAKAREKAVQWQLDFGNHNYSYYELVEFENYFARLGKKYGLLKEFKENGII